MTFRRIAGAKYLYIKRPLYSYLYKNFIDNSIKILFNGNLYRFLYGTPRRELVVTGNPQQLAKTSIKPTAIYCYKQISNDKLEHSTKSLVKPSGLRIRKHKFQQVTKANSKHLKRTSPNNLQLPTLNTLTDAGLKA